ncbi:phage minor head protein [Alloprevotella tannerae]|uniref:phage minor head protein n=1 Tax=Alloprevotella tannerae TaxID=76122 RepID=UPI001EDA5266|nr:phage minor head protein [Alloprevotella tannerae]
MQISESTLRKALANIYKKKFNVRTEIESYLYAAVRDVFNQATDEAFLSSDHDKDFQQQLRHSNEVFSAFKVHRAQNDMAARMLDSNGVLKSFNQWLKEVMPIASHQCGAWLKTEYDTAVIRAHQAADWQQFRRESDVLPNLKWMPSTSLHPCREHRRYWGIIRPINDKFWNEHRPGDRWNCKCSLSSTDESVTPVPDNDGVSQPQAGLTGNPGTTGKTFSDDHPYFPDSCNVCPFYNPSIIDRLRSIFNNRRKDCYDCPYIRACIARIGTDGFKLERKYKNGGTLYIHSDTDKDKNDYKAILTIARIFAKEGRTVRITPRLHYKSEEYRSIYGSLIGTRYERKCPDFQVDGVFYEYEGFIKPWKKKKVGRMLSHGLEQSSRIIIDNTKGCSERFIRKQIMARIHLPAQVIDEVWIYEKGKVRLFYKDGTFYKNNGGN